MNYIGSKFKLSDFIFESIKERVSKPLNECVCFVICLLARAQLAELLKAR